MAVRTKAQILNQMAQLLADNTTGQISAADVRSIFTDMLDSLAFLTDVSNTGVTEGRVDELINAALVDGGYQTATGVNALIGAFLQAAVMGNVETRIAVTYAAGKLNFVVDDQSGGGGTTLSAVLGAIFEGNQISIDRSVANQITINYVQPTPADHSRYALWTAGSAVPTAAQFLGGASSQSDTITVPATPGNVASYLHFSELFDDFDDIREEGSAFNSRQLFVDTPPSLVIGGTTHYIYSSRFAINPYASPQNWVLRRP